MKFVLKYNEIFVEENKAKGERSEKILEKYNWDIHLGKEMLRVYHQIKPITEEEWENLRIRFEYPEKYWKLANYYYTHRKTWISVKNTEKLQNLIRQREAWKKFENKAFENYPF